MDEQDEKLISFLERGGCGHMVWVGSTLTGKSYCMKYLLSLIHKTYDYGILISATADDGSNQYDFFDPSFIHEDWDADLIHRIIQKQKKFIYEHGKHKCPKVIIIIDDFSGVLSRKQNELGLLEKLYSMSRHFNISIMALCQNIKMVSPTIRSNTHYYFITSTSRTDLEELYQFAGKGFESRKKFIEFCNSKCVDWNTLLLKGAGRHNPKDYYLVFAPPPEIKPFRMKFKQDEDSDSEED